MGALAIPPVNNGQFGALQVMGPAQIDAATQKQAEDKAASEPVTDQQATGLAAIIRRRWEIMVRHRNSADGWSTRLLDCQRQVNGQYSPQKLAEIRKFGGSDIYARLTAVKCRGASALLRDVYLGQDMPWGLEPPDDVNVPIEIFKAIQAKVESEIMNNRAATPPVQMSPDDVRDRTFVLIDAAREAAKKKAKKKTDIAQDKVQTLLTEGNFYGALAEFLDNLPKYPFAVFKGPTVKMRPHIKWVNGSPIEEQKPTLWWENVSPFDVWWSPGVSNIVDGDVVQRKRYTRADLNDLLDLPGYDHDAVRAVLTDYPNGYSAEWDYTDATRASLESRESPIMNETGLIDCLEFHGNVQGKDLIDIGVPKKKVPDPMRDYAVQAWLISRYVIKVQLAPSPRKRHPFKITSFDKLAGTPVGNGLPDILADIQDAANAALRATVNNMAYSSGPQVTVNLSRLDPSSNPEEMYPMKCWYVQEDPLVGRGSGAEKPIDFFTVPSTVQQNLAAYSAFFAMADDYSAIPRYLQGSSAGGAGRTASGLAMLMGSASKTLQTVCGNVDHDIIKPAIEDQVDLILLTDTTDMMDGTENIVVKGVQVAMQRETLRSRQMEFLQATANPIDVQITGPKGRAAVLREVSKTLGMPGEQIVPSDEQLDLQQQQAQQIAQAQGIPGHGGVGQPAAQAQGDQPSPPNQDMGPRTNMIPTRPAGGMH